MRGDEFASSWVVSLRSMRCLSRVYATGDRGDVRVQVPKGLVYVSCGKSRFLKPDAAWLLVRSSWRWAMVISKVRFVRIIVAVCGRRVVAKGGTLGALGAPQDSGVLLLRSRLNAAEFSVSNKYWYGFSVRPHARRDAASVGVTGRHPFFRGPRHFKPSSPVIEHCRGCHTG